MINTEGACRGEVDGWKESTCARCHAGFNSRKDLFKHINQEGHVVGSDSEEFNVEHIHRVASCRGRKKDSRGVRNYNKLFIHQNQNLEEVIDINDWMMSHGWSKNESTGHWTIKVDDTFSISTVPFGFVKSRVVTDSDTGHIVETFLSGPTTTPEQVHRNFKKPRSVHVVLEVYEKKGEELIDWDDQAMAPEEQTRYRALAARLNFVAVDRQDLLYPGKECSRRMSSSRNRDWEALKRISRYLIACPRMVHSYRWQD